MKELKPINQPILQTHYPLPKSAVMGKRWKIAVSRKNYLSQRQQNAATEAAYLRVLEEVKANHLPNNKVYFERDYRGDRSENCFAMHSFITSSFYWYLECDLNYDYKVEYDFNNCPFEAKILSMMTAYPLDRTASKISLKPDFETFVLNTLHVQDEIYLHSLKGD